MGMYCYHYYIIVIVVLKQTGSEQTAECSGRCKRMGREWPLGPWEPAMRSDHSGLTAVLGSLLSPCDPAIRLMKHSVHRLSGSVIGIDT